MKKVKELIELNKIQYKEEHIKRLKLHNDRAKNNIDCNKKDYYPDCYFCNYLGYRKEKITLFHILMDSTLLLEFFNSFE